MRAATSLKTQLVTLTVALTSVVTIGVALLGLRMLAREADQNALVRVGQAGAVLTDELSHLGDEAVTAARILGDRPTLQRLSAAADREELRTFLERFRGESGIAGCAVLRKGAVLASSAPPLPWSALIAAARNATLTWTVPDEASAPILLAVRAPVSDAASTEVMCVVQLDAARVTRLRSLVDLPVVVHRLFAGVGGKSEAEWRATAAGTVTAVRAPDARSYSAYAPLFTANGRLVALIEARLEHAEIEPPLHRLAWSFVLLAAGVLALVVTSSIVLGRRLTSPLEVLARAAQRIGEGDLATPVPAVAGREPQALAESLDEMRVRLQKLTVDLRRQQAEEEAVINGIAEGVFTVDDQRRITFVNSQTAAMLGVPAEAILGRFCGDVLRPESPAGGRPCDDDCPILHARAGAGARATEHVRLADGRLRTVVITSAAPSFGRQAQVLRDETDIEATRRARDAILANISHEFKTPLSAQLASLELLLDQLPELSTQQVGELLTSLQRGSLRLTQLIDNLLESVRIEAGHLELRRLPVTLDDVVEEAVEMVRPLFDQRGQTVEIDLPYPSALISGDRVRLVQVFVNLLANAHKFAPEHSTIRIGGDMDAGSARVFVQDQGPGLPQLAADDLFQPFVRADATEPDQGGMGLGLWIARSIVERHGGRIEPQSNAEGTRMNVVLPRAETPTPARAR